MKITILGCGVFGTAIGKSINFNNQEIWMWNKFEKEINELKNNYPTIHFTTNLKEALENTSLCIIAIPIAFLENVLLDVKNIYNEENIIIVSKGIDTKTNRLAYEIVEKVLHTNHIGVLSGGSFAIDMENEKIMGLTLATKSYEIEKQALQVFGRNFLKLQITDDIIGTSICGAIKNVMAIGYGILDGLGFPESSKFLYLTEAIYEIKNCIQKLGGNPDTILSYAGLDDIAMTCTSSKSRNYTLGKMLGSGTLEEEINTYKEKTTIEGLGTSKAIHNLCKEKNINLPITEMIYQILYEEKNSIELIYFLENK